MKNKTLILLCDNYPLSAGEFFIDDEMRVIAPKFDKVLVYTASADTGKNLNRFVPENAEVVSFSRQKIEAGKLKSVFRIFTPMFLSEFFFALKKLPLKYWLIAFKIMYVDIHRATNLKQDLIGLCKEKNINRTDYVFYSYWHDYKALALALLKHKNATYQCVSRAHNCDLFFERFIPAYLPFKKFIVNHLNCTFVISQAGVNYMLPYLADHSSSKIVLSRLGKINNRQALFQKMEEGILIVTCSNLIKDKRVDLIIEMLSQLKIQNLRWVHFGDGHLRKDLELLAADKLQGCQYEFKGIVPNAQILDFYAEHYVDLFVNLSSWEGIPVSIMEALSAGIPILATDVGGTSEIVNEQTGFLVDKNISINTLVQIITRYLQSSYEMQLQLRKSAFAFWKENYNAQTNYTEFANMLMKL